MNDKTNKFLCKYVATNDNGDVTLGGVVSEICAILLCIGVLTGVVIFIGVAVNCIILDSVFINEFSIDAFICFLLIGIGVIIEVMLVCFGVVGIIIALDKLFSIKLVHRDVMKKDEEETYNKSEAQKHFECVEVHMKDGMDIEDAIKECTEK